MDRTSMAARIAAAFTPRTREAILAAVQGGYYNASERFDVSIGSDGATFGTDVYAFACHELKQAALHEENEWEFVSRYPAFRLRIGTFDVACHRVGDSDSEPITRCFPNSSYAGETLAPRQLNLFGDDDEILDPGVVIAHQGSPTLGLCALYLCVPESVNDQNKIVRWGYTELLWSRSDSPSDRPPIEVTLPPEEKVAVPVVVRKRDKGGSE